MATAEFELPLLICDCEHVDVARGVLVKGHGLKEDVSAIRCRLFDFNESEQIVSPFENVRVALLANLTLKFLPVVACHVLTILLHMSLGLKPLLQTLEVDETHRATTLASEDKGIISGFFCTPAEPALKHLLGIPNLKLDTYERHLLEIFGCFNCMSLLEFLSEEFFGSEVHLFTAEVFYSEAHSSQFNSVKLLNFIVKLAFWILQRAYY